VRGDDGVCTVNRTSVHVLAATGVLLAAPAAAQSFNDKLVQPPVLAAPARGSITGTLARFEPTVDQLARGSFSIALPVELPAERGQALAALAPSYSPDAGLSEWGMGWQAGIAITRYRVFGDLDYSTDDFASPWGILVEGTDGYYYPQGFATRIRFELDAASHWIGVDGDGTTYEFAQVVSNARGKYSWHLTSVVTARGATTTLSYVTNPSGRPFLDRVVYGAAGHTTAYRVVLGYTTLTDPFDDYRSGVKLTLDRRVSSVAVEASTPAGYAQRWRYDLAHTTSPLSPVFYLTQLQRTFASGATEPAVVYRYDTGDTTLQNATFHVVPALDGYLQTAGVGAAIQPTQVAQLDVGRDGLVDFEHYYAQATIRQRTTGWTIEATPMAANPNAACRPAQSTTNKPRLIARLRSADAEAGVIGASYSSTLDRTTIHFCDRPGASLGSQVVTGNWAPNASTRLVDLDRDRQPELVRHSSGQVVVLRNGSTPTAYSFAADPAQALTPAYVPDGSWVHDLNGDGLPDLVSRYAGGLTAWFGVGRRKFVAQGLDLGLFDKNGVRVQSLGTYGVWFADANNDGLADVFLSRANGISLFTNRGDELREVTLPAMAALAFTQTNPVISDLEGTGNLQVLFTQFETSFLAYRAYALPLVTPATGLLVEADDGKGTVIDFHYARLAPQAGAEGRTSLLASMEVTAAGVAPVTTAYTYAGLALHSKAESLLGFQTVQRNAPSLVEIRDFELADDIAPVLRSLVAADLATPDLERVDKWTTELRTHLGIAWRRPTTHAARWVRRSDGATIERWEEILAYEREFCPTVTVTEDATGTRTDEVTLAAPAALASDLHCLSDTESVLGEHADQALDFLETMAFARASTGEVTEIARIGGAGARVVQTVQYDALGRVTSVARPGRGQTTVTYDPTTGLVSAVVAPDGVTTTVVARDPLTDAVLGLRTTRGLASGFEQTFAYDTLERFAKRWDNLNGGSLANPLARLSYTFARADAPGAIAETRMVDVAAAIGAEAVDLFTGDGEAFATFHRIPQGWAATAMETHDPTLLARDTRRRATLVGQRPDVATFATLLAGSRVVGLVHRAGFGHELDTSASIQAGVTRKTVTTLGLDGSALVAAVTENSALVTRRATAIGGALLWVEDQAGMRTTYTPDVLGRVRRVVLPDLTTTQSVDYDDYGEPVAIARTGTGELHYTYDATTGLVQSTRTGTSTTDLHTVAYTYDAIGRVIERRHTLVATGAQKTYSFYYDGSSPTLPATAGQVGFLSEVRGPDYRRRDTYRNDGSLASRSIEVLGWRTVAWTFGYFADGSPKEAVRTVTNTATGAVLEQVTHVLGVDGYGRQARLDVNGNRVFDLVYDGLGRLSGATLAGGAVLSTTFDVDTDLPTGYATTGPRPTSAAWTLDARGLVTREITSAAGTTWDRSLTYDARGFLASSTNAAVTETWDFDANGMPSSIVDVSGTRELKRVGAVLTADARQYVYDALGRVAAVDQRTLVYGPDGEIASVVQPALASVDYVYDETGQRVGKKRGGVPEAVILAGTYVEATGSYEPVHVGDRIVGVIRAGTFQLLETDSRGSVLANRTGGAARAVSPFGARATRPDVAAALDYVEKGFDTDLGTVRMGARDYDPYLAQFWTPDPLFLSRIDECARSPVECNLYSYARNNPLTFTDPTGLTPPEEQAPWRTLPVGDHRWSGPELTGAFKIGAGPETKIGDTKVGANVKIDDKGAKEINIPLGLFTVGIKFEDVGKNFEDIGLEKVTIKIERSIGTKELGQKTFTNDGGANPILGILSIGAAAGVEMSFVEDQSEKWVHTKVSPYVKASFGGKLGEPRTGSDGKVSTGPFSILPSYDLKLTLFSLENRFQPSR
jgi:RHS repeat-associated protein